MPYTTFLDLNFDPAGYAGADLPAKQAAVHAVAQKMFGFYAGGQVDDTLTPASLNTIAHPQVVFDGVNSCLRATFSTEPVEVQGAFSTRPAMYADLDAPAGQKVNCWDPDVTKRGRYIKTGVPGAGAWVYEGPVEDHLWWDPNHPKMGLGLIPFGSWINSAPAFPLRGPEAVYPSPPADDWRRARLTFTVRAIDLKKPPEVKLALHCQGNIAARTASLPQEHGLGNYFVPNFYNKRQLLSDALGFNQPDSWGTPDLRDKIEDSGWVDWVVDFSVDDLDWQSMGGIPRPLTLSPYYYGVCPVAELLAKMTGNIYWLAIYPRQPESSDAYFTPTAAGSVSNEISGELLLKRIKAEYWS